MKKLILLGLFLSCSEIQNVLAFWEGMNLMVNGERLRSTPALIPMVSFPHVYEIREKMFHIESEIFLSNPVDMSTEFDGEW